MLKIKIPNEKTLKEMLRWRDKNKDTVRQLDFNNIDEGVIEFMSLYKQHFVIVDDKVFLEVVGGGIDIKFVYYPKTWQVAEIVRTLPDDLGYDINNAIQDMLTVYATSMALIKEKHGVIRKESGDYLIVM